MNYSSTKWWSYVPPLALRKKLYRAYRWATCGALLLILEGTFFSNFSFYIQSSVFLCAIAFIATGLLPYKRLQALLNNPHLLVFDTTGLQLLLNGKHVLHAPCQYIDELFFQDDAEKPGLLLHLRMPSTETSPTLFFKKEWLVSALCTERTALLEADSTIPLFLSYFSEKTYKELKELLKK